MDLAPLGRIIALVGVVLVVLGLLLTVVPKIPLLGQLPGDIVIRRGNVTFYAPLATSVVLSLFLTLLFGLLGRR